jgi:hypothetical protein
VWGGYQEQQIETLQISTLFRESLNHVSMFLPLAADVEVVNNYRSGWRF